MRRKPSRAVFVGDDEWGEESATAHEAWDDPSPEWIDTGLVDARGKTIYRRRDTVKMGFV